MSEVNGRRDQSELGLDGAGIQFVGEVVEEPGALRVPLLKTLRVLDPSSGGAVPKSSAVLPAQDFLDGNGTLGFGVHGVFPFPPGVGSRFKGRTALRFRLEQAIDCDSLIPLHNSSGEAK